MEAGEISEPVKTIYGYHIIRLDNVEEQRQLTYDEAAVMIRERLTNDQREKLYGSWMDSLKEKYPVKLYGPA